MHVDLYEITMAAGYYFSGRADEIAHFELFIRGGGPNRIHARNYYVYAGLEAALDFIRGWGFSDDDVRYLKNLPALSHLDDSFFSLLRGLEFTGDVFSFPEGSVVFPDEPILRVRAPIIQAQLLETALLAIVNHQTTIATKAARVAHAARGRAVAEFGARRAHGLGAAEWGARAAYIGGCASTSNCAAGRRFGIPVVGTLAHSWIMSFESEQEAFEAYAGVFPDGIVLLIDTYDTLEGAKLAAGFGAKLKGVRLDSGDIAALSKEVRGILDAGGAKQAIIFASGDLNEDKISSLIEGGAPVDAFGVGTDLITSRDLPALGGVYKLVALENPLTGEMEYKRKLSRDKATLPGPKQVGRSTDADGFYAADLLLLYGEEPPQGYAPQHVKVLENGRALLEPPVTAEVRERAMGELAKLPPRLHERSAQPYPVEMGAALARLVADGVGC